MTDLPTTINKAYGYESEFVIIPNSLAQCKEASLEAIGLLTHLLSLPSEWIIKLENLHTRFNICESKLRRIIKELIELGYVARESYINNKGQKRWMPYQVFANPAKNPTHSQNPLVEIQHVENQQVKDIKDIKNDKEKKLITLPILTDSNRETSDTDLKPNPAQLKLLQTLTRRWTKVSTYESRDVDMQGMGACISNGWIEQKRSYDYIFQIRLSIAGKAIKSPAKPKVDPGIQAANRALADKLALAMDVKPVGKDYGNYIKVARDLNDAGIKPEKFSDYLRYVHGLSARQGGWDVTVNSLTSNGRMSEYIARQNPNRKTVDPNAPVDMGRMVPVPPTLDQYGNPFVEGKI